MGIPGILGIFYVSTPLTNAVYHGTGSVLLYGLKIRVLLLKNLKAGNSTSF